jgi:uncharacterized DUF497 family protein
MITRVDFEWDPAKAESNLEKHGVDFADAAVALEDPHALTIRDPCSEEEERFISVCIDPTGRTLVVVFTWRSEKVRMISARQATRRERREYEGG